MKTLTAITAALAIVGSSFNPSYANDEKIFPGSVCKPVAAPATIDIYVYSSVNGGIVNDRDSTMYVVCPLTRDSVTKKMKGLEVKVEDWNRSGEVRCVFRNPSHDNNVSQQAITSSYRGSGKSHYGRKILSFAPSTIRGHYLRGAYVVGCTLQGRSRIISLRLIED